MGSEGRKGRDHRFPIADGAVKGRPRGAVVEGRVPGRAKRGKDISQWVTRPAASAAW